MASIALVILLIHVIVVAGFGAAHARAVKRSRSAAWREVSGVPGASVAAAEPAIPTGRQLEEYVQAGLVDLRIMLVQASRRGHA